MQRFDEITKPANMSIDWRPLAELIERNQTFLLTSHLRADCDAIGSEIGLALVLESLGKRVTIVNGDPAPAHIRFMDREGRVKVVGSTAPLETLRGYDALVVVDTSAWGQLGDMAGVVRSFAGEKAVIDHHVSEDDFGALMFKDATAEATGRLILELAEYLDVAVTTEIAEPLFTAIATDTGWFRFSSVTAATFSALAKLTAAGARPAKIFSQLFEQHSLSRLMLRGRILDHVKSECSGRLLWTYVTAADFAECKAEQTDTEDAINMLLSVAGSETALMFAELKPDLTKVSLRSRTDFDVRKVAEQFGGGGHKAASGISFPGPRESAQNAVLDAVRRAMG